MQEDPRKTSLFDIGQMRGVHDICLDDEILDQKIDRISVIGEDAADLGGRRE